MLHIELKPDEFLMVFANAMKRCIDIPEDCSTKLLKEINASTKGRIRGLDKPSALEFERLSSLLTALINCEHEIDFDDILSEILNSYNRLYPDMDLSDSLANAIIKISKEAERVV